MFIGTGYVAYFVIVAIEIPPDTPTVPAWWTPLAMTTVFAPGWAMLITSAFTRTNRVTTVWMPLCCGLGYLAAVGSWFLVWTGQHSTSSTGTWLVTFPGLAALTLVITPRPWIALPHLAIALPAVQIANSLARSDQYGQLVVTDIAWGIAFSALFVLAGMKAVHTGDRLDVTYARTAELVEETSKKHTREEQRKLYRRLVHDSVLNVMRNVVRANSDRSVGRDARAALRDWAAFVDERSSTHPISPQDVLHRLRRTLAAERPEHSTIDVVVVISDRAPELPPVVPMRVGIAIADAAGEAVRNARRHAGPQATIVATAQLDRLPLQVTISDDGPGFDVTTIATTRLGLTESIIGCMSDVGGHAHIHSWHGVGTTIELRWPR